MRGFVNAYRKDTGEKVRIPAHWFDIPRLAKPFQKTPRQKAAEHKSYTETPATGDKKE